MNRYISPVPIPLKLYGTDGHANIQTDLSRPHYVLLPLGMIGSALSESQMKMESGESEFCVGNMPPPIFI
jgi:hypothetical protein